MKGSIELINVGVSNNWVQTIDIF